MRTAYCAIRSEPIYRARSFVQGLEQAGFYVAPAHTVGPGKPGDVLVIWNRYGGLHETALRFERAGGTVIVAENGYVANDRSNRTQYALAIGGHNGQGEWRPRDDASRWKSLGIALKPWRSEGKHVLVCPNRSFGRPGFIMPPMWPENTVNLLRRITKRPVVLRPHPGNDPARRPLALDLKGAWAVVIWSSSAGCEAMIEGIPVFCESPAWICKSATSDKLSDIERPRCGDAERDRAFERLAWAQWHIDEVSRGIPFQHLLN